MSPLLFNIYINDLAMEIKNKCKGVSIGADNVCLYMYADDIALVAESEGDLQIMLNVLSGWCKNGMSW